MYTACLIGGISCYVDPDTLSPSIQPLAEVVPAIDGTTFVNVIKFNPANSGSEESVSVSGTYLPLANAAQLQSLVRSKSLVTIQGLTPNINDMDKFLIVNFSYNPIKPAVAFPEDGAVTVVRCTFQMTLQRIQNY